MIEDVLEAAPVAILVRRGDRVESAHRVAFAIADADGRLHRAAPGDGSALVHPRSAVKPLQALAMVESGAARRFELTSVELALACASHGGEPMHVRAVRAWLRRLDLAESALGCGAHPPAHGPSADALLRAGEAPAAAHNNCSGKHAAMLTLARHLDAPIEGYTAPGHPVQRRIASVLGEMAGRERLAEPAIDGCGVPTWPLPLAGLATAMARLGAGDRLAPTRAEACARIGRAMTAHPELVAGSGRSCTAIMATAPHLLVKSGAEGVYVAAWPARRLGLALKVVDGASRAAPVALLAILDALGALDAETRVALDDWSRPMITNHARVVVGTIEPAPGWPGLA